MIRWFGFFWSLILLHAVYVWAETVALRGSDNVVWAVQPETGVITASAGDAETISIAQGFPEPSVVEKLLSDDRSARWLLPQKGIHLGIATLPDGGLEITVRSESHQQVTLPRIELERGDDLIWARGGGSVFPVSDPFWREEIFSSEWNTIETLSLPVWGIRRGGVTVSWLVTSPFRNTIRFETGDDKDQIIFTHDFNEKSPEREIRFRVYVDKDVSPIQPALHYRKWLQESGRFVSLADKEKNTPGVSRLRGAVHAYLWGDALLSPQDILKNQWKPFCRKLVDDSGNPNLVAALLRSLFSDEQWSAVEECAKAEYPYVYVKQQIATALSDALGSGQFSAPPVWQDVTLPQEIRGLYEKRDSLSPGERTLLHGSLLVAAYPGVFLPVRDWGGGVSVKMLRAMDEAGIDRAKLCTDGWGGVERKPWIAQEADRLGWLFGTYDSYHSIHDPKYNGTDSSWETAQMTQELFDNGSVMRRDGSYLKGFKGIGRKLNPVVARPYVEERVGKVMENVPFKYYFLDCDAYGEVYDDYHPGHPISMEEDAAARCARLEWVAERYNTVIGSEGGNAYSINSLHVAEGIFGPFFGWGDEDMGDKDSPFYRGRYYPPDEPEIYFKPIPVKERFQKLNYDPRYRVPLHAAAFHDAAVVTHHWNNGHFKYPELRPAVALTEILYLCPPMAHFTLDAFEKRKEILLEHYRVWSPLHRAHGFDAMTGFRWLTDDRTVQESAFGDDCRIVVNFGDSAYELLGVTIPPGSAWIDAPEVWGEGRVYTPAVK